MSETVFVEFDINLRDILPSVTHAIRGAVSRLDSGSDAEGRDEGGVHRARGAPGRGSSRRRTRWRGRRRKGGVRSSRWGSGGHGDEGVGKASTATVSEESTTASAVVPLGKDREGWECGGEDVYKGGTHLS